MLFANAVDVEPVSVGGCASVVVGGAISVAVAGAVSVAVVGAISVLATAGGASAIVVSDAGAGGADVVPDPLVCRYPITASTVFCGPACSQTCTLPALSMTTTPRLVLLAAFFMPMAPVKVAEGSHRRGKGRLFLVAKVVFDLEESVLRP